MTDEDVLTLLESSQRYDELSVQTLLEHFTPFVERKARSYFLVGGDHEDLVQEGMIGLYDAIRTFEPSQMIPFIAYANVCITRQMLTAIKAATRQKHQPLNRSLSLDQEKGWLSQLKGANYDNPEEWVMYRERLAQLEREFERSLSPLERNVFERYVEGETYQQIAKKLNRSPKSIDNALQRMKQKIAKLRFF